ncbi:hypothetical protein, partial [Paraliobacillus quinghaiensis]
MKFKLFLAMILSVSLLAACGGTDDTTEDTNGNDNEETDVVTTASIVSEADAFVDAVSEDGTWIIATLNDITLEEEVVVAGEFHNKDNEEEDVYRKIAVYTQDEDRNIVDSFTVTVPQMTVQSPNLNFQGGTLAGDVYVEANGFQLHETSTIEGNLTFASQEYQDSANIAGEVTGETTVEGEADVVTTASIVNEADAFANAVSEDGTWIIATLSDITLEEEIVVAGEFHNKDNEEEDVYRKIAVYTQDEDRNIVDSFTVTVPQMTVQSPNLNFQGGTLAGDVYVEANGFQLHETSTIEGNLTFASQEYQDSANIAG